MLGERSQGHTSNHSCTSCATVNPTPGTRTTSTVPPANHGRYSPIRGGGSSRSNPRLPSRTQTSCGSGPPLHRQACYEVMFLRNVREQRHRGGRNIRCKRRMSSMTWDPCYSSRWITLSAQKTRRVSQPPPGIVGHQDALQTGVSVDTIVGAHAEDV